MDYVCGDAMLQFAYSLIPTAAGRSITASSTRATSRSKRQFLVDAADAGIRFDPCFRHAAFEDSEFAFRLMPRGLRIRYARKRARGARSLDGSRQLRPAASPAPARWRSSSTASTLDRTSSFRCGGLPTSLNRRQPSSLSRISCIVSKPSTADRHAAARARRLARGAARDRSTARTFAVREPVRRSSSRRRCTTSCA